MHGCFDEVRELIDRVGLSADDDLIAVGDILDCGPESPAVLGFFQHRPNARSLLGNHERKHLDWWRGRIAPALSQRITRLQLGEKRYPAVCAYLDTLPRYLELPEAIVVHGFLEPGVPLAEHRETVLVGVMSGQAYLQERYSRPWYELYDGEKAVIVGHQDYLATGAPFVFHDRVFGIDTGCYRSGALTGLLLPEFHLISVPARADHYRAVRAAYASQVKAATRSARSELAADGARGADIEMVLRRLFDYIMAEHWRVLGELRNEAEWNRFTEREQAKRYAERVRRSPIAAYLYRTRQGGFSAERLRGSFRNGREILDLAGRLGLQ
jgi:serine/threonine protein phosphatase 1